jgi:hypothetical protein
MQEAQKAKMRQVFSAHAEFMRQDLELFGKDYPEDVQEAYKITIQLYETLADPNVDDKSLGEALFTKVSKERLEWAKDKIEWWHKRDERRAEARERERERRERNRGKMEERRLTKKKNDELYEKFETMRILRAVDELDKIRSVLSDKFHEDGFPRPPEIRDKLLKLHEKAHDVINVYDCDTDLGLFDLAWDIEFELFDLIESFEAIRKVIDDLTELCPTEEEEWEQENQKDDQD